MTLRLLRLITGATIAAAVASALTLASMGNDMERRSPAPSNLRGAATPLPAEPTAAGPAPEASSPAP